MNSGSDLTGKIQKKPREKPVEEAKPEDPFPKERLKELYRADQLGDRSVLRKYGIQDENGKDVPAKREEYEAALARFARDHGDELSALADEIEAARATTKAPADVEKK